MSQPEQPPAADAGANAAAIVLIVVVLLVLVLLVLYISGAFRTALPATPTPLLSFF